MVIFQHVKKQPPMFEEIFDGEIRGFDGSSSATQTLKASVVRCFKDSENHQETQG